jgi:hypothetical protein
MEHIMEKRSWQSVGMLLAAWFACYGCDASSGAPPASASAIQAKVKGKVTLKGKPLARMEIRFNPANIHRRDAPTAAAKIGDDGSYEVSTLVGENTVTLAGRTPRKQAQLPYTVKTIEVKKGDNTLDFVLP